MGAHVQVDQALCISSGRCVADHPTAFEFDDQELSRTTDRADDLDEDDKVDAARNCPGAAILLHDEDGVEVEPWS